MEISQELIDDLVVKVKQERGHGVQPKKAMQNVILSLKATDDEKRDAEDRVAEILLKETLERLNPNKRVTVRKVRGIVRGSILKGDDKDYDRHELQLPTKDR